MATTDARDEEDDKGQGGPDYDGITAASEDSQNEKERTNIFSNIGGKSDFHFYILKIN